MQPRLSRHGTVLARGDLADSRRKCLSLPPCPDPTSDRIMTLPPPPAPRTWSDCGVVAARRAVRVGALRSTRLADQPIVGEESRWATGAARDALHRRLDRAAATGRRVPRAAADDDVADGARRLLPRRRRCGRDSLAECRRRRAHVAARLRLHSGVGLAGSRRSWPRWRMPRWAQVLQIGRMGESEAVFTLLVSASLLVWHLGYIRSWRPIATWSLGFALHGARGTRQGTASTGVLSSPSLRPTSPCAAIGGISSSWQYAAGVAVFLRDHRRLADSVLSGHRLALGRGHVGGARRRPRPPRRPCRTPGRLPARNVRLPAAVVTDPRGAAETRNPRAVVRRPEWPSFPVQARAPTPFLLIALAVAYPTVWIVAGAPGPLLHAALSAGRRAGRPVIDRCSVAVAGRYPRRAWHQFLLCSGTLIGVVARAALIPGEMGLGLVPAAVVSPRAACRSPWPRRVDSLACYRTGTPQSRMAAVAAIALFAGIAQGWRHDELPHRPLERPLGRRRRVIELVGSATTAGEPDGDRPPLRLLLSSDPIAELDWPRRGRRPAARRRIFLLHARSRATRPNRREAGRGRPWTKSPGTLPFAWEEVATLCVERRMRDYPQRMFVLARVVKPRQAQVTDATKTATQCRQSLTAADK